MSQTDSTLEALRKRIAEIEGASSGLFDDPSLTGKALRSTHQSASSKQSACSGRSQNAKDDFSQEAAFQKIVRLVNHAEQSSKLLRKRLVRDGFPEEIADTALERAMNCGIIDDLRYAEMLVHSRINQNKGLASIKRELENLGVDPDSVDALCEYKESHDEQDEIERAFMVLSRQPPRAKNVRESAYRKLVQKGFSSSIASHVARRYAEDLNQ